MKKKIYIKTAALSVMIAAMSLLSSCLKDHRYVDFGGSQPLVEFPVAAYSGTFNTVGLVASTSTTPFTVTVNLASPTLLSTPVTVNLAVSQTALDAYNKANNTSYTILPSTAYTTSGLTLTIPANSRTGTLTVNVNTSAIPSTANYVLPLVISSATGATPDQYNTILYAIKVKNQYDGSYLANGTINIPPSTSRTWSSRSKTLATIDATTSETEAADLGTSSYIMRLKVNADNTVTVTPSPSSANQTLQNNGTCKYDPSTKTFTLNYKYVGASGDRTISETIKMQ
ncbi:DUF1735 domain-containing protein [Mucilaginibacter robiniae]|uniref:DUF1735 domain-containing protein n=1 Tax=Mucilaginibacter robiniae TaxID=2728022 RepID=A0A7L5E8A2_9SPHI|nr:DUF1735 domain-containing protein [Mucilaginibacter robiniae]QJD96586.1 DUF1735 domain-containing protein [Mucilaginibacter robiniae]